MAKAIPHGTYGGYTNHKCRCDDCNAAMRAYHKARYERSPEKYRTFSDAWSAANPDRRRAISKASRKRRYEASPELRARRIAEAGQWAKDNRAKRRVIANGWKQRNPAMVREAVERRRARKAQVPTYEITARDWFRLCAQHDDRCAYCGERTKLTMDHVVPIVRGGQHSIGNLLPVCRPCNSSKGPKLLVEWRRRLALLT